MKKPVVDKVKCIGCGLCASIAAKAFNLNDKGEAEVVEPVEEDEAKIQEAKESCPVEAIK